jgi:hypothetical protein
MTASGRVLRVVMLSIVVPMAMIVALLVAVCLVFFVFAISCGR